MSSIGDACRDDFPALSCVEGKSPVYLDSGATTLRPNAVIDAMRWYLEKGTAAVHRGVHKQSIEATDRFEATRESLAGWLGADTDEIIFTSGATASINLVRRGLKNLKRVALTTMEHHSNFVPWLDLESCTVIPVNAQGAIDMEALERTLTAGIDLLAITHVSNVLGCITPIESLIKLAHQYGAMVLVDAAQSASHHDIDVKRWGVDFLVCSSHKMLGPGGIGALYARRGLHEEMEPVTLGGQMVDQVTINGWTKQPAPYCFEAGSPAVESVIGWGAAIDYLDQFEKSQITERLECLTQDLLTRLQEIPGIQVIGPNSGPRGPLVTFVVDGLEAHAIARILSHRENILVRSGFHCAQPLHDHLHLGPTTRASLQIYNTEADLDRFVQTLHGITKLRSV